MRRVLFVVVVVAMVTGLLGVPSVSAEPPICQPNRLDPLGGCIPSPVDCASGEFNGAWKSPHDGRFATCVGYKDPITGRPHIEEYVGGDVTIRGDVTIEACGAIIRDDQMVLGGWVDPNERCGPYGVKAGSGGAGNRYQPASHSPYGAVASGSPEASAVGVQVLAKGGNAVDAAVATVFAVGVVSPEACGIGGGGFLLYRGADGTVAALDFRERAPAALPEDFETTATDPEKTVPWGTGPLVVGVPGTVAGMTAVLDRYGSRPLRRLLEPAIALANRGVELTALQAETLAIHAHRLARYHGSNSQFLDNGQPRPPYPISTARPLTDLANTLRLIADKGAKPFYRGEIAQAIVEQMGRVGEGERPGVMTAADLADYTAIWRDPLRGSYRGHEILAVPPPTSGGIAVLEMLNLLEGFDLPSQGSADHLHLLAEAKKLAWADRNAYVADPDHVAVPTEQLVSKAYAGQRREDIDMSNAKNYSPGTFAGFAAKAAGSGPEGPNTEHVSVVDAAGNAVSVTCSVEQGYGSAVVVEGRGFVLNSQLTDFDEPGTANQPAGGKRPRSSTSPVIVAAGGTPRLVVGGVGGPRIPMAVALAISNVIDFDMEPALALDVARPDADGAPPDADGRYELLLEHHRVPTADLDSLRSKGHKIRGGGGGALYHFWGDAATVHMVGTDGVGTRFATSDPRGERGGALVVTAPPNK